MNKNYKLILAVLFSSTRVWAAGDVALKIQLSPAGSFDASSNGVEGFAVKEGDIYKADTVKVNLKELKSGVELRDEHMQNKYLEVEKFPTATLKSARGEKGDFTGELEVHGVSKTVSGKYEIAGNSLKAKFTVKMSDYNIAKAKYMGVGAKDEVNVESSIPIRVAAAEAPAPDKKKK